MNVYSVSAVNRYISGMFAGDSLLRNIFVKGEISNCKYHSSGHIYFTLKDEGGAISGVMFYRSRARGLNFRLENGMSVIVHGYIRVYEAAGRYELYAVQFQQEGSGILYERFEALKKKLDSEGLFDPQHKKKIPPFVQTLGVVGAAGSAGLQDIYNIARRRNPWIRIIHANAQVQGRGAAEDIARAVKAMDDMHPDVMIVGRGGGSIEDLWAFNEEIVARTVYACRTPVISAVGHQTDYTIIDFVSDQRAPTPSAAAELAVPDIRLVLDRIRQYAYLLDSRMDSALSACSGRLSYYREAVRRMDPMMVLTQQRRSLLDKEQHLNIMMDHSLEAARRRADTGRRLDLLFDRTMTGAKSSLQLRARSLEAVSPLKVLARGYSHVTDEQGHTVSRAGQLHRGQLVHIRMEDGSADARVEKTGGS